MLIDSSYVLAELDPQEVIAIASRLIEIDRVVMAWTRLRGDIEFGPTHMMN